MIELILREDVKHLGKAGQVVKVKPGYARNFLLPHGLAYEASEGNKKRIQAESRARSARLEAEKGEALAFAAQLNAVTVTIKGNAGEEGRLFGSVTAQDIAAELKALGHTIDRRRIDLEHPLKTLGEHSVSIRLHPEVEATIRITIVPQD